MSAGSSLRWALALLALLAGAAGGPSAASAQAPPGGVAGSEAPTVTLAFFTPQLAFPGSLERSAWQGAVARHLSASAGVLVEAKGFARAADFSAFLARQPTALAVVDAQLALSSHFTPLLQAVGDDGLGAAPLVLATLLPARFAELRGKSLILATIGGAEQALVDGPLLAGELPASRFFARLVPAPDVASAAAAVSLGKADACLVPPALARARGLAVVHATEPLPLPVLVEVRSRVPQAWREALLAAFAAAPPGGGVAGWRAPDAAALAHFAASLAPRGRHALVPAALPWLPLHDGPPAGAAGDGLPLEPLPAAELYELPLPMSDADFAPRGELSGQELPAAVEEGGAAGVGAGAGPADEDEP